MSKHSRLTLAGLLLTAFGCEGNQSASPPINTETGGKAGAPSAGGSRGSAGGTGGAAGESAGGGAPGGGGPSGTAGAGGAAGDTPDAAVNPDPGSGNQADAGSPPPPPTEAATVQAFRAAHVYFAGEDNKRRVDAQVAFPQAGPWKSVTLNLRLSCPQGRCDYWDRWAYLAVVNGEGNGESLTEIMRFVTPFRVGANWTADVTALQPLLTGNRKLAVFIDTWVGPNHPQGNGWLVDASFEFEPGQPERVPVAVLPVWDIVGFEVGDPAKATTLPERTLEIPAGASAVELRSFITGHGQGNFQNCAEFCPKTHTYRVGERDFNRRVWRDDCVRTAVPNQAGTWQYPRAGWCPGALVTPWVEDITAAAPPGASTTLRYAPEPYVNTCRSNEMGPPVCSGCAPGRVCEYDNGSHTPPNYQQSALLVVYR